MPDSVGHIPRNLGLIGFLVVVIAALVEVVGLAVSPVAEC